MARYRGLIDSNVLIAATVADHVHSGPSFDAIRAMKGALYATATHCLSEAYSNLTRPVRSGGGGLDSNAAIEVLERFDDSFAALSLTVAETRAALRSFANAGGKGPTVYDYLIGYVALVHFIPDVVTWNTRHFTALFPQLRIITPNELLETL